MIIPKPNNFFNNVNICILRNKNNSHQNVFFFFRSLKIEFLLNVDVANFKFELQASSYQW